MALGEKIAAAVAVGNETRADFLRSRQANCGYAKIQRPRQMAIFAAYQECKGEFIVLQELVEEAKKRGDLDDVAAAEKRVIECEYLTQWRPTNVATIQATNAHRRARSGRLFERDGAAQVLYDALCANSAAMRIVYQDFMVVQFLLKEQLSAEKDMKSTGKASRRNAVLTETYRLVRSSGEGVWDRWIPTAGYFKKEGSAETRSADYPASGRVVAQTGLVILRDFDELIFQKTGLRMVHRFFGGIENLVANFFAVLISTLGLLEASKGERSIKRERIFNVSYLEHK